MSLITKEKINDLIKSEDLIIRPLLEESQITEVGIDFRLGINFLISSIGRSPLMIASLNDEFGEPKDFKNFFQETRRQLGETITLYPNQTVLGTSLEYVKLPNNAILSLYMRSSYSRLGLTVSTIAQPGYCGCLSLELTNNNNCPINLTIGARIFQGVISLIDGEANYFNTPRKYSCAVRPQVTNLNSDKDLTTLNKMWKAINNIIVKS